MSTETCSRYAGDRGSSYPAARAGAAKEGKKSAPGRDRTLQSGRGHRRNQQRCAAAHYPDLVKEMLAALGGSPHGRPHPPVKTRRHRSSSAITYTIPPACPADRSVSRYGSHLPDAGIPPACPADRSVSRYGQALCPTHESRRLARRMVRFSATARHSARARIRRLARRIVRFRATARHSANANPEACQRESTSAGFGRPAGSVGDCPPGVLKPNVRRQLARIGDR